MFILKDENQIKRAIEKARTIKPFTRILSFGCYQVRNSKGTDFYTVLCKRDRLGNKTVACNCKASERGLPCYHAAVAIGVHVVLAEQRQTAH